MNKLFHKYQFLIYFSIFICLIFISTDSKSQTTYKVQGKNAKVESKIVTKNSVDIIKEELKKEGLNKINELIKLAKSKKNDLLLKQFSSKELVKNPNNNDDILMYAKPNDVEYNEETILEIISFFNDLDNKCGKKTKIYVFDTSKENEPIGFSFRLNIPGKIAKGDLACNQYTISFRRGIDGNLFVDEWYIMPGNMDCNK
jgi:hypothetical protein